MKKMLVMSATVSLAALAACGGEEQKSKAPKAAAATALDAGQWQSRLEVKAFRKADEGRPRLNMPVGTKADAGACITAENATRPPPALFLGPEYEDCAWGSDFYMRGGRLMGSMICQRDGVGEVPAMINVNFTATSFEGTLDIATRLVSDGDVVIHGTLRGERSAAACTAGGETGAANSSSTK